MLNIYQHNLFKKNFIIGNIKCKHNIRKRPLSNTAKYPIQLLTRQPIQKPKYRDSNLRVRPWHRNLKTDINTQILPTPEIPFQLVKPHPNPSPKSFQIKIYNIPVLGKLEKSYISYQFAISFVHLIHHQEDKVGKLGET